MKKLINRIRQYLSNTSTQSLLLGCVGLFMLFYTNCSPSIPDDIVRTVISDTKLDVGSLGEERVVRSGETVKILGQDATSTYGIMVFWVTTENGERGYIPQEAVDNRGIIYDIKSDELPYQDGDEVKILRQFGDSNPQSEIQTKDGKKYEVSKDNVITVTGKKLLKYSLNGRRGNVLSRSKFERLYLGKSFEDAEEVYREAFYVAKEGENIEATYELFVYDPIDGVRYKPTIKFENDKAVSYTLKKRIDANSFVLGLLPMAESIIDFGLFANRIKGNTYSEASLANNNNANIFLLILIFIGMGFMAILFIVWVLFSNQVVSFLLCGSLSFRYPLKLLSNKAVAILLAVTSYFFTYIWIVLMLCYGYHWWYFIPILCYVNYKVVGRLYDFLIDFPSSRCPKCKLIDTIHHHRNDFMGEYQEWRSLTEKGQRVASWTDKWTSFNNVTTTKTYSDGSKKVSEHKENIKNHSETTDVHQYSDYKILYFVQDYRRVYKCEKCEFEEYNEYENLEELDRKLLNVYTGETIS